MEKLAHINKVIREYFELNTTVHKIPAKDLMPYFIRAGIFTKDVKSGLPIRNVLRQLDSTNRLSDIPYALAERKLKNTNWFFVRTKQLPYHPAVKSTAVTPEKTKSTNHRKDSDEHYVIDLCDEILGLKGSRQHRFDFLRGDAGTKLPIDVYYESLKLVIEFNEQQHTKAVKHFDKPDQLTVSGVHRGEQRKLYDKRKRDVLPQYGIIVIDLSYFDFACDARGKIHRDKVKDLEVVKNFLKNMIK